MNLYAFSKSDVEDLLSLISAGTLSITANNALRVAQLQQKLREATPTSHDDLHGCEECKARVAKASEQKQ